MIFFDQDNLKIINDDCINTQFIQDNSIDLICTSPPYNVQINYDSCKDDLEYGDYLVFTKKWLSRCFGWLKDTGRMVVNVPFDTVKLGRRTVAADVVQITKEVGFNFYTTCVWDKGSAPRVSWGSWQSCVAPLIISPIEALLVIYKGEWKKADHDGKVSDITREEFISYTSGLWKIPTENRVRLRHPAPFNVELPHRCIKLLSFVGDTVLDPFLGSGSTAIAAYRNNRKAIGVELSKEYCELAKRRLLREIRLKKSMIF